MGGPYDFGNDGAWDPEGKGNDRGPEQTAAAPISTPTSARPLLLLDTETTAANPWKPDREQWLVMVSLTLFRGVSSVAAFYGALVNGLVLYTALYYVPIYSMAVQGSSPMRAGIDLLPAVFFLVPGSVVAAILTSRFGRFRWAIWCGWGVTTLASGLFHLLDSRTSFVVFAVVLALFGAGNGMVLTGVNAATQAIASPADRAMAAGVYSFMRSLGMAVGVALSGTVFQNAMAGALAESGLPASIARDSERYIAVLQTMEQTDATRPAILEAYTKGFHAVSTAMAAFSAGALLFSLFIRSHSME